MMFIADFHIHSKFSLAASRDMDLEMISKWSRFKGINLISTGDITHPLWLLELRRNLKPLGNGLFKFNETNFILTGEVSCIFAVKGKPKKMHLLIFAPGFEFVEKINKALSKFGDLTASGRPALNLSAEELVKIISDISTDC